MERWGIPYAEGGAERVFLSRFGGGWRRLSVRQTVRAAELLPALAAMTPLGWRREGGALPPSMPVTLDVLLYALRR